MPKVPHEDGGGFLGWRFHEFGQAVEGSRSFAKFYSAFRDQAFHSRLPPCSFRQPTPSRPCGLYANSTWEAGTREFQSIFFLDERGELDDADSLDLANANLVVELLSQVAATGVRRVRCQIDEGETGSDARVEDSHGCLFRFISLRNVGLDTGMAIFGDFVSIENAIGIRVGRPFQRQPTNRRKRLPFRGGLVAGFLLFAASKPLLRRGKNLLFGRFALPSPTSRRPGC